MSYGAICFIVERISNHTTRRRQMILNRNELMEYEGHVRNKHNCAVVRRRNVAKVVFNL
jgi:hypothetical protein